MGAAPHHRQGIAAGVLASARNVGMVLGVGLAGAVFATVQAQSQALGAANAVIKGATASFVVAGGVAVAGVITSLIRE
jgi:hypothetical protein